MISLFILKSCIRGMNYGVGTYVSQLTTSLMKYSDINIYLVDYFSEKYNEFTIIKSKNRLIEINIPCPKIRLKDDNQIYKYATRLSDILTDFLHQVPNVVFLVNYPTTLPFVTELKKRFKCSVLSVVHSAIWQMLTIGCKKKFIDVWMNRDEFEPAVTKELREEKQLYEIVDRIVSVTQYMRTFISQYYDIPEEKIVVIPNGLDSSGFRFLNSHERIKLKEQLGFQATEKIILFSGRLDKGKGLHFLLQAFNEVFRQNKNVSLVIMGEDSGMERINEFLSYCNDSWSKVTFTGFLKYNEVIKFYQIADVGIIPSIYDHCPYTAIEMMAHSIPLIISNTEGLNEMFTDSQAVYMEPIYDIDGKIFFDINNLANTILSLIYDEGKCKDIIKDYPELIKNKFSSTRMAREMYEVLKSLS